MNESDSSTDEQKINFASVEFCKQYVTLFPPKEMKDDEEDSSPDSVEIVGFPLGRFYLPRLLKWLHDELASGTCIIVLLSANGA